MLAAAEAGNTKRLISALGYVRNINYEDDYWKDAALHKAADGGHKDIVQLVLEKGASTEAIALHKAAYGGHESLLINSPNPYSLLSLVSQSCPPMNLAVRKGHTSTVELLLEKGASKLKL